MQVRDHVKKGNGKPPRWRRMLGYHFMARTPRDPAAVMLQVIMLVTPLLQVIMLLISYWQGITLVTLFWLKYCLSSRCYSCSSAAAMFQCVLLRPHCVYE